MAVKFNFASTDNYLTRLTDINDTFQALSKLSFSGSEVSLPTGAIRLNSGKFQIWSGSAWGDYKFDTLFVDNISDKTGNGVVIEGSTFKNSGNFVADISATNQGIRLNSTSESSYAVLFTSINGVLDWSIGRSALINNPFTIWDETYGNARFLVHHGSGTALAIDSSSNATFSGKVGIGTTPSEKLHLNDGNFLVAGTYGSSPTLSVSGAGTRMFFYPKKAAFRAGYVSDTQWNDVNIESYSVAMGYNTTAYGLASTAMGSSTTAYGFYSTAMGSSTTASGIVSTAMGRKSRAVGNYSFAINLSDSTGPDVPANTFWISGATKIGGNLAWDSTSDRREKEDIRLLVSELDKINMLKPSRFKWKEVNEGVEKTDNLGLIAQEVREVYPEVVKGDEDKEILSLEYTGLIAPMIKAIQELTTRLEILENKG